MSVARARHARAALQGRRAAHARRPRHRRRHRRHDAPPPRSATWATRCTSSSAAPSSAATRCELGRTIRGGDPADYVAALEQRLVDNPNVHIHLESELADFHGFIGNFSGVIAAKDGKRTTVDHGVVIVATGAREERPALYGLGESDRVVTGMDLERMLKDDDPALAEAKSGRLHALRRLARRDPPLLLAHLLPAEHQERHRAQGARPVAAGLRVVQGDPHLRLPRGVLHEGARAGRHLHALRQRRHAAGQRQRRRLRSPTATRTSAATSSCRSTCSCWPRRPCANEGDERAQQPAQGAAHGRGLLPRGARQAAPRRLRQRGHLPLRLRPLPQGHRRGHQPGLRGRGTRRRRPGQAGHQGRRRRRRGRPGQVRRLPHLRARLPLRGAGHRPETKKAKIEAAACQGCGVCVSECPVKAIVLHHYTDAQIFAKEEALFMEVS